MSATSHANRASVLTPSGRGAVAVVAATGQVAVAAVDASFQAANGRPFARQERDRIVFGHWTSGSYREEVVLVRGADDSLEIHCHGGAAAAGRIVAALAAAGCEIEPWQRWVQNASANEIVHEAKLALAASTTRRTATVLLDQLGGALTREVAAAREELRRNQLSEAHDRLTKLLAASHLGQRLTHPWQVAIAGHPNVGKSSLLNALVGYQRAIVFDQPGTTRDVLSAETAIDGWPVRLTDAAGIRDTVDPLEAEGVARARQQLSQADLVLWVFDASATPHECNLLASALLELEDVGGHTASAARLLVVLNKCDLLEQPLPPLARDPSVVAVSALAGTGIDSLLGAIAHRLVPTPPQPGDAVLFTSRHATLIESALQALNECDAHTASYHLLQLIESDSRNCASTVDYS